MNKDKKILRTPLTREKISNLNAGDFIYLSGTIYTARDAAHLRLMDLIKNNKELPIEVNNQIIYYVGPTPSSPDRIVGSAGPTTSGRMDDMTIPLLERGLSAMIGKGNRSKAVIDAMTKYNAVYFAAIGGAGAVMSRSIRNIKVLAFDDLGPESIKMLEVEEMPLIVAIDSKGNNLYNIEQSKYYNILNNKTS